MANDLLSESDAGAAAHFIEQVWAPAIQDRNRLQELTLKLDRLREDFLFHTVIVAEFRDLGTRMSGKFTREDVLLSSAQFVDFLHAIATQAHGDDDDVTLEFRGREIIAKFVLVANQAVYAARGSDPYFQAVEWSLRRSYRSIYLLSRGRNFEYAQEVAMRFRVRRTSEIDRPLARARGPGPPLAERGVPTECRPSDAHGYRV